MPRRRAELVIEARRLATRDKEAALFSALDSPPPPEFPFDLAVKAALCVPLLFYAGYVTRGLASDLYFTPALLIVLLPVPLPLSRFVTLGFASHKRGTRIAWLLILVPFLAAGCIFPPLYPAELSKPRTPSQQQLHLALSKQHDQQQLRLTLSTQHDLSGVDLRRRDLRAFYLYGKVLSHAELSRAKLARANFTRARLTYADLDHADLSSILLNDADLRHARLSNTQLYNARLRRGDLRSADLSYAHLALADLRGADLRGATLFEADLTGVDLRGASLAMADFLGVRLSHADIRGADVRRVKGLSHAHLTHVLQDRHTRWPPNVKPPRLTHRGP